MTNRFPALAGPAIASAFVVSFLGQPAAACAMFACR
jgi:hypothetical protein